MVQGWFPDGPHLPVEFSRVSPDGRVTLVLVEGAPTVPALWANTGLAELAEARRVLARREGIEPGEMDLHVGFWSPREQSGGVAAEVIGSWAESRGFPGAVWTALPPGLKGDWGSLPSSQALLAHLGELSPDVLTRAREYVERAPAAVDTPFRRRLAAELGWTLHGEA
ncbi:MAG: hypothetical protein WEA09_05670 [Gemmatimonadota bacterium]